MVVAILFWGNCGGDKLGFVSFEKERKIEVERQREFQILELFSPLALYLCLLFLFFFIWFLHFSQTNRFGFKKRQNRGTHQNCPVDK